MTNGTDELTPPFVQRLRDDLLEALPRHRRRRRRRQRAALGAAAAAVVAVAALAGGAAGDRRQSGSADRSADVATESTVPGTPVTTSTTEPKGVMPPPDTSLTAVEGFLDDLRRGDLDAAARRWSGYPTAGIDDFAVRVAEVERMRDRLPWLADPAYRDRSLEAPIWSGDHQVVTVTASTGPGRPKKAAAFVVDRGPGGAGPATIERLPSPEPTSTLPSGTAVTRGQEIVVPVGLVEAVDVVAWFGGGEVPVRVTNEVDAQTVAVRVPETVIGETVLTILTSTPEVPAAYAFWYTVRPG